MGNLELMVNNILVSSALLGLRQNSEIQDILGSIVRLCHNKPPEFIS